MTMSPKEIIARRVAKEVRPGSLVNLGIGLPTLVEAYMPPGMTAFFLTENGLIGIGAPPPRGWRTRTSSTPGMNTSRPSPGPPVSTAP